MIIKGIVSGQTLVVCPAENLAEGTVNAICAEFTFSPEWRGLAKTAFFMRGSDGPYQAPISSDGTIAAAAGHLNFGAGLWKVSVAGERFEDGKVVHRLTTGVAHFVVSGSIVDPEGQPFPGVPPTGQGEPGKPALIGDNGNWLVYNIELEEYVDTGLPSRGPEGPAGKDGYTPVKGVDYFDGAPGAAGPEGPAGPQGVQGDKGDPLTIEGRILHMASDRPEWETLIFSDGSELEVKSGKNGSDGEDGRTPYIGSNGNWWIPGKSNENTLAPNIDTGMPSRGEDGTSVSIANISESTESGGTSVVTFSDGKTLHVRNGLDGQGCGGGAGWTKTQAELLKKILQSAVFNSDVSADILILCNSIGTSSGPVTPPEDEPDEPVEVTITQNGNILAISGVTVSTITQNGNILAVA